MSQAVPNDTNAGITVKMPFTFDVDGLTAELFGEQYDLSGTIIDILRPLAGASLYDSQANTAWLNYLQGENEDNFDVYVDQMKAAELLDEVKASTYYTEGQTYSPTNSGVQHVDASGVFDAGDTWNYYNSMHDFVLSWFANKILGHPGALAAISNDSYLRAQYTQFFDDGMAAIKGADGCAIDDVVALADRSANTVAAAVISSAQPANGMSQADLRLIVQQIMNLAPGRFQSNDRGFLHAVQWYEGDMIQIQLNMTNNSYAVAQNAPGGTTVTQPDPRAVGPQFATNAPTGALLNDQYILQFHVGA
jgi:hypothetical protein